MSNRYARKAVVAFAIVALGAAGPALIGGTAFAGGHGHHDSTGGDGGGGGDANANCLIPIGVSVGVLGQGDDVSQCNAVGGDGGDGGDGADY